MTNQVLTGKRIVVTGAGAGIGWGIAQACAQAGARLALVDVNPKAIEKVELLKSQNVDAEFFLADLSDVSAIETLVHSIIDTFDGIDGLVNNAGVTIEKDFLEFELDELERLWTTNLRSVFLMCQSFAKVMKEAGSGSIVNVASNHAHASVAGYEMYAATKAGIAAMSRSMCWSLGSYGIRVNILSPGLTRTEAVAEVEKQQPRLVKAFNDMHADGRYCTVEEMGNLAVFLLSDLSSALTGSELLADHGLSASLCNVNDLK